MGGRPGTQLANFAIDWTLAGGRPGTRIANFVYSVFRRYITGDHFLL